MPWWTISTKAINYVFGYQSANKLRDNVLALASAGLVFPLGGSRYAALPRAASYQNAVEWIDVRLDGTLLSGLLVTCYIDCRTDGTGSVTPRILNVDTAGFTAGSACSASALDYSGSQQQQEISLTLASGLNRYRLQGLPSANTVDCYVNGYIKIFATS